MIVQVLKTLLTWPIAVVVEGLRANLDIRIGLLGRYRLLDDAFILLGENTELMRLGMVQFRLR